MKGTRLVATLVALALALAPAACGGEDGRNGLPRPAPARRHRRILRASPRPGPTARSRAMWRRAVAAPVSRTPSGRPLASGRLEQGNGKAEAPQDSPAGSGNRESKPEEPKLPPRAWPTFHPRERRALRKDLYEQGQEFCYAYGPKELAKSFNLTGNDRRRSRRDTRAFPAAAPTLILPYRQGWMGG